MSTADFLAARAFVCETCTTNDDCGGGACNAMWCCCACNVDPEGVYAPQVDAGAFADPDDCFRCGGPVDGSRCVTCGYERAYIGHTRTELRAIARRKP